MVGDRAARDADYRQAQVRVDDLGLVVRSARAGVRGRFPFDAEVVHVITAYNPGAARPGADENAARQARLVADVAARGLRHHNAVAGSADGAHVEPSVLVVGLDDHAARALGAAWGQDAVFRWTRDAWTVLACDDGPSTSLGWTTSPTGAREVHDGDVTDMNEWNRQIIEEFRNNEGKVGGPFEGATLLLLHHTGRKSGTERVNPIVYRPVGENFAVFASKVGADDNPDWYHNLIAHPDTTVEVGTRTVGVHARDLPDAERDPIWEAQKEASPGFAEYEQKTSRRIPVVLLEVSG